MSTINELEIYACINGFPNYLVTSHGRVLSLKDNHGKDRIKELKQIKNNRGYLYVNLCKNGKSYHKTVHRLVAQSFIPNPDNKPQVNHIDENKHNNHVSNLEWATVSENINHGTRNEKVSKHLQGMPRSEEAKQKMSQSRIGKYKGKQNPKAKSVIGFKLNGCDIKYYKYIKECERDGFNSSNVIGCCRKYKGYKAHKGYVWYYADEYFYKNKKKESDL